MPDAFVTIAWFRGLTTAQFYTGLLQSNGVHAFLPEECTAALRAPKFWFLWLEAQIRLMVPTEEQEQAMALLREAADRAEDTARLIDEAPDEGTWPAEEAEGELQDYPAHAGDMTGLACLGAWLALTGVLVLAHRVFDILYRF